MTHTVLLLDYARVFLLRWAQDCDGAVPRPQSRLAIVVAVIGSGITPTNDCLRDLAVNTKWTHSRQFHTRKERPMWTALWDLIDNIIWGT
jgi:hypothetical protein